MSRLGNIFYISLVFGALWGVIWTAIITLLALFVSGLTFQPQVTAGAVSGLVASGILMSQPYAKRSLTLRAVSGFAFIIVLLISSGAEPLGLPVDTYAVGQIIFAILMAALVVQSIHLVGATFGPGREKRYNVEVLCLRFLKGIGLVSFTIAVEIGRAHV